MKRSELRILIKEEMQKLLTESEIDGVSSKTTAIRKIYKGVGNVAKGIHSDDHWKPINQGIFKRFDDMGLDWNLEDTEYQKEDGVPTRKIWKFEIRFTKKNGKLAKIGGHVTAAGAGTVDDPLSKYDVTLVMY